MFKWFFQHISPDIENLIRKQGVERVCAWGRGFGDLLWNLLPSRRRLAINAILKHIKLEPENAKREARRIARESFEHNCQSFAELLLAPDVDHQFMRERIEIVNPDIWERLKHYPGPGVAVTAHLGAWEILSGVMGADIGHKEIAVVVRKQRNPGLYSRIEALRGGTGAKILGHRDAAPKVLRMLKKNGLVAFLVDHNCNQRDAAFLPFLNDTAAVNIGPAVLAVRAKAAVWPIFLLHDGEGRYKYYLEEPLITEDLPGTREEKIQTTVEFYNKAVEKYVKLFPEQWFWMHKRWKTRPPEELEEKSAESEASQL